MLKETYSTYNKRRTRGFFFARAYPENKNLVGLCGPDIEYYLLVASKLQVNNIDLYENSTEVMLSQLTTIKTLLPNLTLHYEDILNAPYKNNTIYDLDFCSSILNKREYIEKYKNNSIFTFSLRPIGIEDTIRIFFDIKKEEIFHQIEEESPINHRVIYTNKGEYLFSSYKDTSSMCMIMKTNLQL